MKAAFPILRVLTVVVAGTVVQPAIATALESKAARFDQSRFRKVLLLGSSITLHGPEPSIGRSGNWGIAATAEEKDYLQGLLGLIGQEAGTNPKVEVKNIADVVRRLMD